MLQLIPRFSYFINTFAAGMAKSFLPLRLYSSSKCLLALLMNKNAPFKLDYIVLTSRPTNGRPLVFLPPEFFSILFEIKPSLS